MKFNLRKNLLAVVLLVGTCTVFAQTPQKKKDVRGFLKSENTQRSLQNTGYVRCASVEMDAIRKAQYPDMQTQDEFENWLAPLIQAKKAEIDQLSSVASYMAVINIPIIFHIITDGAGSTNLAASQVQAQIDQLNLDFNNLAGSSYGVAASADINFIPAMVDPSGTPLAEPGINRVTAYGAGPFPTGDFDVGGGGLEIKSTGWDYNQYANVWVGEITGGILGYAQFPSNSTLPGLNANGGPSINSGVVCGTGTIGSVASPGTAAPYNLGRTLTHEVGHWIGLRHIWGDGDCTADDFCADTPNASGSNFGCATGNDSCTADADTDMVENYMDYSDDACMDTFTADQVLRILTVMDNADGLSNLSNSTAGSVDYNMTFTATDLDDCEGGVDPVYTFDYDAGDSFSTQVDFTYTVVPTGPIVVFSQDNVTNDTTGITATVTGATTGNYTVTVTGTYGTEVQNYILELDVYSGTPNLPVLNSPTNGAVGVLDYTLTWVAETNASSYEVEVATDAGFGNIIEGPVSVNTNQYIAVNLTSLTEYFWRVKAINPCTTTAASVPFSFTTDVCTVCPSVGTTQYATSTTRVAFNTIDNPSGKPSGYSDYTDTISTDVLVGNSYDLIVQVNTDGNYAVNSVAWIDWNQNCVFDVPSEEYDLGGIANQTDGAVANSPLSITVPAGAIAGSTIMRVTTKYSTSIGTDLPTSCEDAHDAEVEDYTINVLSPLPDADSDGIPDVNDNCVNTANADQADMDGDLIGDVCDDSDGDGIMDDVDNCPTIANPSQIDTDGNGQGDVCQDTDNDGVFDTVDNCINTANPGQEDWDSDGEGDVCDDSDGDGIMDDVDNCVTTANADQADWNSDGEGDVCDDTDLDGVMDDVDNCPTVSNPGQADDDSNGVGNVCQDTDNDGIFDTVDNCINTANADQADWNSDGEGDVCDDTDLDGIMDDADNCVSIANADQADWNSDGEGDVCDDTDLDGIMDDADNCVSTANAGQADADSNGIGDACQDTDSDGILDLNDNCPTTANADQADWNSDGEGDVCDNSDGDSHMDDVDNCVSTDNEDQADVENDGIGDACQVYDADNDGILDDVDNCVNTANPGQEDADGNGVGDACQDTDLDTVLDINDNCPTVANTDQSDIDGNGIGDLCQDTDSDGVLDIDDNCPLTSNSDQADVNNDGIGDVCESVEPADTLTPNGDGFNDTWNIKNIEYVSNNTVKVFSRHGVKVSDISNYNNISNNWGGESTEGGSGLLPAGSYYYVIEYISTQGEAKVTKGWMYINY